MILRPISFRSYWMPPQGSAKRPGAASAGADFVHDVIHVSDVVDAHVAALKALEGGAPSAAYNLGLGRGFSLGEVIAAAAEVTGLNVPFIRTPLSGRGSEPYLRSRKGAPGTWL
ncbi:MAG: hypothetical protein ACLQKK_09755 [Rhodomicrobium sp.]